MQRIVTKHVIILKVFLQTFGNGRAINIYTESALVSVITFAVFLFQVDLSRGLLFCFQAQLIKI